MSRCNAGQQDGGVGTCIKSQQWEDILVKEHQELGGEINSCGNDRYCGGGGRYMGDGAGGSPAIS